MSGATHTASHGDRSATIGTAAYTARVGSKFLRTLSVPWPLDVRRRSADNRRGSALSLLDDASVDT
jgi:hypothetical protein